MLEFLPEEFSAVLKNFDLKNVDELRLRVGKPSFALINGKFLPVGVTVTQAALRKTITALTEHSLYRYEENLKNCYLVGSCGERVGICGERVVGGDVGSVKNVSSLCIRLPREVKNCAYKTCETVFKNAIKNLLVISAPGAGKTTFLRDTARILSDNYYKNVLLIDEKGELSGKSFDVGKRTDVMKFSGKSFGLKFGVTNMRPDVIVLDELTEEVETKAIISAVYSGVNVVASAHGASLENVKKRSLFAGVFAEKIFDFAVVLSDMPKVGTVKEVVSL
ncbi:MAG: Flp pilus assembly complex ATPase component TadA [Clostridia bacterium]|nr:Flp pilus assembly complex ATPase component TadA [Clostridia bacterium]